jgi:hypothetical protein
MSHIQDALVVRILPQDKLFDYAEEALSFAILISLGGELLRMFRRVIYERGEQNGPT